MSSRLGCIIHCQRPTDQRLVCGVSIAHLWLESSRSARRAEPTHICSRSNSARISVASLPPFISMPIASVRRWILTLSGHGSQFIPPRVPYFRASGTLMCTCDVLHNSRLTPDSTRAMPADDTFINRSLYAAALYSTARHKYCAGAGRARLRAMRLARDRVSCVSALRAVVELP